MEFVSNARNDLRMNGCCEFGEGRSPPALKSRRASRAWFNECMCRAASTVSATHPNKKARRRTRHILLMLLILGCGLGFWFSRGPRFEWKDKPAGYWIGRLSYRDTADGPSAEEFLFAAGPAVVPELIAGLRLRDSWIHDKWVEIYFKLGKWQRYFQLPTKRSEYRANCARGLAALGVTNALAETELLHALNDADEWVRSSAVDALSRVAVNKNNIVPKLIEGLHSTNSNFRLVCIVGLVRLLPGSREAGEALRQEASDTDVNIRSWIAEGLGGDDTWAGKSFEVLTKLLQDPHATVRDRAAQGLGKLKFSLEAKTRELMKALEAEIARPDKNEIVIWKIEGALGEIGPGATAAVPALRSLTKATNTSRTFAIIALSQIERDEGRWEQMLIEELDSDSTATFPARELGRRRARVALPALQKLASSAESPATRHMAAVAAWRIDQALPDDFTELSEFLLTNGASGKYELVQLLGEIGPEARVMIPVLQRLRFSRGSMMRDYAEAALARIDREYLSNPWKEYSAEK